MATKTSGAKYVDGFVFSVSKKNLTAYKKMAREAAVVWKRFGALDYKECMGEDLTTKATNGMPPPLSFMKLTATKPNETVWFSYITFKNKTHRNKVNKMVMNYFNKKYADKMDQPMPFEVARVAYGGFSVVVD